MFKLQSPYSITPEQRRATSEILTGYSRGATNQVLLGVTGSGKTFVMANIIKELGVPAMVLSPNKTLAAQLYQEFRAFFPENRVGYFISYYDYYQPEAYVPQKNLYIAKEVSINPELERLRIDATRNILEARHSVTVASVSSIYNIGSPDDFFTQRLSYSRQTRVDRESLLAEFVNLGYMRTKGLLEAGQFRVRGNLVEVFPFSEENPLRFSLKKERIGQIDFFDPLTGKTLTSLQHIHIYPTSSFFFNRSRTDVAIQKIRIELEERVAYFKNRSQPEFAERLKRRTLYDLELLEQFGYCPGIENYSLYLSGRKWGAPPYTLLDFYPRDFLTIVDESHITIPQLGGMFKGDRSRKLKLVEYGFRLPSALENRPLRFDEIRAKLGRILYASATPSAFEIRDSGSRVTELLVRPTGLPDPEITVKQTPDPVADMLGEIEKTVPQNRALVTTLTKKMAEKLSDFLSLKRIRCAYLHSEIKPLDRIKIIRKLRQGEIDVLVGINLLREGLDLPEVALVCILDADREGFLRSQTSLIQTFGRAARNAAGRVILYIDRMNRTLESALRESDRRRRQQLLYNQQQGIVPTTVQQHIKDFYDDDYWMRKSDVPPPDSFNSPDELSREIEKLTARMKKYAKNLDFKAAASLRNRIRDLKNWLIEWT